MKHAGDLYALQVLEGRLGYLEAQAESSEEASRVKKAHKESKSCRLRAAEAEARRDGVRKEIRALEDRLSLEECELAAIKAKLFSGEVTNPKELSALHDRLESGARAASRIEESLLEKMLLLEETDASLTAARSELDEAEVRLADAVKAYKEAVRSWNREMKRLREERDALRARIDVETLREFDQLSLKLGGNAVAKVEGKTCGGCRVALPTSAKAGETARCPNCGRLLCWA